MNNRLKALMVSGATSLLPLAFAQAASAQTVLKFAHILEINSAVHQGALAASDKLAECTAGAVTMEIFPGGQLGNEAALNNGVRVGGVDIVNSGTFFLSNEFPLIGISTLPYIFRDRDHALAYIGSDVLKGIMDDWHEATGQYLLSAYYGSAFHIMANNAYVTPGEMSGQRIRTPDSPAWTVFPIAVGAVPTPIAFGEVYLALQQGVVDGSTMSLPLVHSQKFYEVVEYMNMTYHSFEISFMIVGAHVRRALDDAQWDCLQQAADVYAETAGSLNLEAENSLRAMMTAEGMVEFVDVDLSAYQGVTAQVIADRVASGALPAEIHEAIEGL